MILFLFSIDFSFHVKKNKTYNALSGYKSKMECGFRVHIAAYVLVLQKWY